MIEEKKLQLRRVPKKFITQKLCLAAVRNRIYALQEVPKKFRTDKVCLEAVKRSVVAIQFVPEEVMTAEICFEAIKRYGIHHPFQVDFLPKNYSAIDKEMKYEEYEVKLLEGRTIEELLTHRHPWFREQGKKKLTTLSEGE